WMLPPIKLARYSNIHLAGPVFKQIVLLNVINPSTRLEKKKNLMNTSTDCFNPTNTSTTLGFIHHQTRGREKGVYRSRKLAFNMTYATFEVVLLEHLSIFYRKASQLGSVAFYLP